MKVGVVMVVLAFEIDLSEVEPVHVDVPVAPAAEDDNEPSTLREGNGPRTLRGLGFRPQGSHGDL